MARMNLRVLVVLAAVAAGGIMLAAYAGVPAVHADHVPDPDPDDVFVPPHYIGEIDLPYGARLGSVAVNATHIFAVDSVNDRVRIFTMSGNGAGGFGSYGAGPGHFNNPHDIALNATHIFVTDMFNHRIQVFDMAGNYAGEFGLYNQLKYPSGIAIGTDPARIYVTDSRGIRAFDHAGNYVAGVTVGVGLGFGDMAIGPNHIYAAQPIEDVVMLFSMSPQIANEFGWSGDVPGAFRGPAGIALTETHAFVADTLNHRIQIFDITEGWGYVDEFGRHGDGPGEFRAPTGIALSPTYMFVTDPHDDRIQIFTLPYIRTTGP